MRRVAKTRNRNEALDIVEDRIETLAHVEKQNMKKMNAHNLKTAKTRRELTEDKGEKGNSKIMASKIESNSSGKMTDNTKHCQVNAELMIIMIIQAV
jgi:hypothetical protein